MNSIAIRTRSTSAASALLALGVLLTILMVMFRPSGAEAQLPIDVYVFKDESDTSPSNIPLAGIPRITKTYKVWLNGADSAVDIEMTGVPISSLLTEAGKEIDPASVAYVKIRRGGNNDGALVLVPLSVTSPDTPPMILDYGRRPGLGAFPTPAIVRGQEGSGDPIFERQIAPFDRKTQPLSIIPGTGAIMGTKIKRAKLKNGGYRFSVTVTGSPGGALQHKWFTGDEKGDPVQVGAGKTYTTTPTSSTRKQVVNVVVTAPRDGSTGTASSSYTLSRADDGAVVDPGFDAGPTSGPGTIPPAVGSPPTPTPSPTTSPSPTTTPSPTPTPTPSSPQPTPPTPQPTAPTSKSQTPPAQPVADTSGLVAAASKVRATGPLQTINGVLLTPPAAGSSDGGSPGLTPLQNAVASIGESIFQPVDDPRDLWPYMVAVLFAIGLSGAAREWINP